MDKLKAVLFASVLIVVVLTYAGLQGLNKIHEIVRDMNSFEVVLDLQLEVEGLDDISVQLDGLEGLNMESLKSLEEMSLELELDGDIPISAILPK